MKFKYRRQSTGKVYPYIAPISQLMYLGFFRKVYLNNIPAVQPDTPILLAANHPTAFVDPCLLCSYLHPPIYNMTRGDVFRKPFFRRLMESINMFPVYRVRDGYTGRERNDEVFDYCINQLHKRRVVTIYVEGEHHSDKHIRPVQKGIARIAFGALEKGPLPDLCIIPAGCNYLDGDAPRDVATVNIGAPILVRDYWEDYRKNPAGTISRLCKDIEQALKPVCYHIENPEDEATGLRLLALFQGDHPARLLPVVEHDTDRFARENALLDRLNTLAPDSKTELAAQLEEYFLALEKAGLRDEALQNPGHGGLFWWLFFLLGFIPFILGLISSWPLMRLAHGVAKSKVKKREFFTSVVLGTGFLGGLVYYPLLVLIALFTRSVSWISLALALPLLGWFFMFYREIWKRWWAAQRAIHHPDRARLLTLRKHLAV